MRKWDTKHEETKGTAFVCYRMGERPVESHPYTAVQETGNGLTGPMLGHVVPQLLLCVMMETIQSLSIWEHL